MLIYHILGKVIELEMNPFGRFTRTSQLLRRAGLKRLTGLIGNMVTSEEQKVLHSPQSVI